MCLKIHSNSEARKKSVEMALISHKHLIYSSSGEAVWSISTIHPPTLRTNGGRGCDTAYGLRQPKTVHRRYRKIGDDQIRTLVFELSKSVSVIDCQDDIMPLFWRAARSIRQPYPDESVVSKQCIHGTFEQGRNAQNAAM